MNARTDTNLIVQIMSIDMIFVNDKFHKMSYSIHMHRFQFSGFEASFLIIRECHISETGVNDHYSHTASKKHWKRINTLNKQWIKGTDPNLV